MHDDGRIFNNAKAAALVFVIEKLSSVAMVQT